jgi:hypothetical protein
VKSPFKKIDPLWWISLLLVVLMALVVLQYRMGGRTFDDGLRDTVATLFGVLGLSVTGAAGMLLYFFRCRSPYWYGLLEIFVGAFGAFYVGTQFMEATGGTGTLILAEIAALYVIVRGLDNLGRSMSGERKERWDRFLFGKKDNG